MALYKIKNSNIDNKGLVAYKDIKKGTKIIEYKGKVISTKQSANDPKFDNSKAIYLFNLNKRYDLDGDFKFNIARLINRYENFPGENEIKNDIIKILKFWNYTKDSLFKKTKILWSNNFRPSNTTKDLVGSGFDTSN